MASNEEISTRLELIRNGFDPDSEMEYLSEIERPFEWVDGACIIDFDSWPVNDLSITIKTLFEESEYRLEEGTPTDGIYGTGNDFQRLLLGWIAFRYRFKVEIYSDRKITYLKISRALSDWSVIFIDGFIYGNASYSATFKRIISTLKYLQPNYDGYMVCQKCGGYYKLHPGELPEDFDVCTCGVELEYYPSSKPRKIESPKSNSLWDTITLLIPLMTLITLFVVGLFLVLWDNSSKIYYLLPLAISATLIVIIYIFYHIIKINLNTENT